MRNGSGRNERKPTRRGNRARHLLSAGIGAVTVGAAAVAAEACVRVIEPPRRVILFVADGAGVGHWSVARVTLDSLAVEAFPSVGLIDTRGYGHLVTESAASATAFATGVETFEGALGVGPDSLPRRTVLEAAQAQGLATGLITTTFLTDATPAAFVAHYPSRDHREVARQIGAQDVTVLLGGGRLAFASTRRADSTIVLDVMRQRYTYVTTADELAAVNPDTTGHLLGLFADQDMPAAAQRRPSLADMTAAALDILDRNPRGYFLLVENEDTDTRAHANESFGSLADEMRAVDEAVRVALVYQARHPETLIVVLGDHETGGLSLLADTTGQPALRYTTRGHTAAMVPVFARGPGSSALRGVLTNERVGQILMERVMGVAGS